MGYLLMPKLSDTMEEGTILSWLVPDGSTVERGQSIVEIETDKADMTVEAMESGVLVVIAHEGDVLAIGAPIAQIGDADPLPVTPAPDEEPASNIPVGDDGTPNELPSVAPHLVTPVAPIALPSTDAPSSPGPESDRVIASPLARALAADGGLDLAGVHGTGPGGRIIRADVEDALKRAPSTFAPAPSPVSPAPVTPHVAPGSRIPATRLQRTIARRMSLSSQTAPHFTLQRDVDATRALEVRAEITVRTPDHTPPTLNDFIIRAVALAASEQPEALAQWDNDTIVIPDGVHIGLAVAVDRGLVVPVLRDAAQHTLLEIAAASHELISRCRDNSITAAELEGSTMTISNLGMFGIDRFTAVLNPPEAAILAVGAARPRPVVHEDAIVIRTMMTLTLSVDHRSLYGAEGARFLGRIAELIEAPYGLVAAI